MGFNNFCKLGSDESKLEMRSKRFEAQQEAEEELNSNFLLKSYTRTTGGSTTAKARTRSQLRKAFKHICSVYAETQNFDFLNDQIRQIRQEMTSTKVSTSFQAEVYCFHARECAKEGNLDHFVQCASQLERMVGQPVDPGVEAIFILKLIYLHLMHLDVDVISLLTRHGSERLWQVSRTISRALNVGLQLHLEAKLLQRHAQIIEELGIKEELHGLVAKFNRSAAGKMLDVYLRTYALGIEKKALRRKLVLSRSRSKQPKKGLSWSKDISPRIVVDSNGRVKSLQQL